jgi:hypothetical protein
MIRKLRLALVAALALVAFRANAEEGKKEKEGDSIVGKKFVLSDKAVESTVTGVVVGRERLALKVKVEKVEGTTEWKNPKGETVKITVGETVAIYGQHEKGEDGKWHPAKATAELYEKLRAGDKLVAGLYFDERLRPAYITVTARGEGEKQPEKKPEGDKKPEPPKGGGGDF